jgi:hypothetical protein
MRNGLSATEVWVKAIGIPDNAPITIVLNDKGKKESATLVSDHVNRGEQVLAIDLLFFGDASPGVSEYAQRYCQVGKIRADCPDENQPAHLSRLSIST